MEYNISGMSCAACSQRVEKAVSSLPNVESCTVNLLTNSMNVSGTATDQEIIDAVIKAGYSASKKGESDNNFKKEETRSDETKALKRRIVSSLFFLVILMYFSMGNTMFGLPLPEFLSKNPLAICLIQMLLAIIVMIINKKFFISGFKGILNKSPNMDSLVALGSFSSFAYSLCILFYMTQLYVEGNITLANHQLHEVYFESAAMILTLITVGKTLESVSKKKTTDAINSLINLAPKTATVVRNGKEMVIPVKDIIKGDIFLVKPGESIPADGVIIEGHSAVNESALTGESIPVDKEIGDLVSQSTINEYGFLKCEAQKVGEETLFSKIIKTVNDASSSKAPIAKVADKVSGIFVPIVIIIAIITFFVWLGLGESVGFSLARAVSVLVISCPCALGLATPVAIMVGNGVGAKHGILFKNAQALEYTGKIKIIALDKTGTITKGKPEVTDIIPFSTNKEELLKYAYSLELKSEHPLAKAIIKKAQEDNITHFESEDFKILPGNGLSATINENKVYGGNLKFIEKFISADDKILNKANELSENGKTPLFFSKENVLLGIIAVTDTIREDSFFAIKELKQMGIKTVMLTGDNIKTALAVKKQVLVDEVIADVLPNDKASKILNLKSYGKTAMVGDGINDAPALISSDVGIAIGGGTDVAIETSDVVLLKNSLSDIPKLIKLSKKTLKIIHQNLFWAFIYNIIGIPLAAGVFIPFFNLKLNPMFGALAMSLSSFCVVTNALRLNNIKFSKKEKKKMEVKMNIEGMMCMHCEARVKKCLEEIDGVSEAIVSHEQNSATIKTTKEIPFDTLKKTVEAQGYKVI